VLERLARLGSVRRAKAGAAVAVHWAGDAVWSGLPRLALYASMPDEMPTHPLFDRACRLGRRVLWPRIEAGRLAFAACGRWEDLIPGHYGVPAPPSACPAEPLGTDVLLLVPGLAFDAQGRRLGRGGGYYDRLLSDAGGAVPVGVAFDCQIVERVPEERHDRRVAALLTESGLRRIGT
jgi:5-formyltetrahydrofolate cyclo-ligase